MTTQALESDVESPVPRPAMPQGLPRAFAAHLESENDVLRCAALRAFVASERNEEIVRRTLLSSLEDPDPDIRSDAMERLSGMALPEDAPTIRASLQGDPVREVKLSAVALLSELQDRESVGLLRALVLSRCEDRVAWEDEEGDWDDWLDVQIAAIEALGRFEATESIGDLLAARKDEFGQSLDLQVFDALGRMGEAGVETLLELLDRETGPARRRIVTALAKAAPDALAAQVDALLGSEDSDLRLCVLGALAPDDPRARALAIDDPEAQVRRSALRHAVSVFPDLAKKAILDPSEIVQVEALTCLSPPIGPELHETLVENMLVWLQKAGPDLARVAATKLPRFAPNRSEVPLLALIEDADRPLEARTAAVTGLGAIEPPVSTSTIIALLENPAQQVRAAVLLLLKDLARAGNRQALRALTAATEETLLVPGLRRDGDREGDAPDLAMPKGEGGAPRRLRITPDGDLVEGDRDAEDSTLTAILAGNQAEAEAETALAEDTPEESQAKRRKRRPVEGPDEIAESLSIEAMRLCGDLAARPLEAVTLSHTQDRRTSVRRTAWTALSSWPEERRHSGETRDAARAALSDLDPEIRLSAFDILARGGVDATVLAEALKDDDALLRAKAVRHLPVEAAIDLVADDSLAVRTAAIESAAEEGTEDLVRLAVDRLLRAEHGDSLGHLVGMRSDAAITAKERLASTDLPARKALVVLEALSGHRRR